MNNESPAGLDLVVFDLGGTTIEDSGQVLRAFEKTLQRHAIDYTPEELVRWRGASKREALAHFAARQSARSGEPQQPLADALHAYFQCELEADFARTARPVPAAEGVFAWLRDRGVRVALTTGFSCRLAGLILRTVGWDTGHVDAWICGDDVPRGRPAPYMIFRAMEATGATRVQRVAKVGDTALDLEAAHNAGAGWAIGVLGGAHDRERLASVAHTAILDNLSELPEFLTRHAGLPR